MVAAAAAAVLLLRLLLLAGAQDSAHSLLSTGLLVWAHELVARVRSGHLGRWR